MNTTNDCKTCQTQLPDLLLEPEYASEHPELALHMAECGNCRLELEELRATFALLEGWTVPEPSPFFDSRLRARLREAQEAAPEGFWERTKAWIQFSTGRSFRPALAGALAAVMIMAGAGTFVGLHTGSVTQAPVASSATVNDLKILDNNDSALKQMDQLLDASNSDDTSTDGGPTT
jgi:hypothetical protein